MSDNDKKLAKATEKVATVTNGFVKGNHAYSATTGANYKILLKTSKTTVVNVIDKTAYSAKQSKQIAKGLSVGAPQGRPLLRVDGPHAGANYPHLNIDPKLTNLAKDPHLPIGSAGMQAGTATAKVAQTINKINKVAVPLAIAVDTAVLGYNIYKDVDRGTSRNTVETAATIAGGWGGGYGGAVGGAAIGTAIMPGIGTIVGGIVGGLTGGIGGSVAAGAIADQIGDANEYDIEIITCEVCKKKFKARVYLGEKRCSECPKKSV